MFNKDLLPAPELYYDGQLTRMKIAGQSGKACCPFHNERTPSFKVNLETGSFKCFGCGEGGSMVDFQMKIAGQNFVEACKSLGAWER